MTSLKKVMLGKHHSVVRTDQMPPSGLKRTMLQKSSDRWGGRYGGASYGSLTGGGIVNFGSGLGTAVDKTQGSFFTPTRIYWKAPLEIIAVESWAARNFINIPVNDMFVRWRRFKSEGEDESGQLMTDEERRIKIRKKLAAGMKAGRLYGTGAVIILTKEAPMDSELMPERIRSGDLIGLLVVDRFEMSVHQHDTDPMSPNYGKPILYDLHPTRGGYLRVHHTRVIRFDGITPPSDAGFTMYEQEWGMSEIVPVITSILEDATLAGATAHLSQEASIPVLRINGLRDILAGMTEANEASIDQIGSDVNRLKSIYNLLMLDKGNEEFERVSYTFAGLADLMDRFSKRVAAAGEIPLTRFMGQSPAGLNATGDSDMKNYVIMLEAKRALALEDDLIRLDTVMARSLGIGEAPEYEWQSLIDLSEEDQAKVAKLKAEAVALAQQSYNIDEDEGRSALDGDPVFGELPGSAPEPPEPPPLPEPGGGGGGGGGQPGA